jgi:hypothetical protein
MDLLTASVAVLVVLVAGFNVLVAPSDPRRGTRPAHRVIHLQRAPNHVDVSACQPSTHAVVLPEPQQEWPFTDGWH